jgi:hypothetical protein
LENQPGQLLHKRQRLAGLKSQMDTQQDLDGWKRRKIIFLRLYEVRRDRAFGHDDEADAGFHRGELGVEVGTVKYDLVGDAVLGQGTNGPVISGPRQDRQRRARTNDEILGAHPYQRIVTFVDDKFFDTGMECRVLEDATDVDVSVDQTLRYFDRVIGLDENIAERIGSLVLEEFLQK